MYIFCTHIVTHEHQMPQIPIHNILISSKSSTLASLIAHIRHDYFFWLSNTQQHINTLSPLIHTLYGITATDFIKVILGPVESHLNYSFGRAATLFPRPFYSGLCRCDHFKSFNFKLYLIFSIRSLFKPNCVEIPTDISGKISEVFRVVRNIDRHQF